jgi:hypothetical protein
MILHISGSVREMETGRPISGLTVEAYDADTFHDNLLGRAQTDEEGHYDVPIKSRVGFFLERPDAYILLKDDMGRTLKSTRSAHLREIEENVVIDVPVSCYKLVDSGLLRTEELPPELNNIDSRPELLRWSFRAENGDLVFSEIEKELASKASLLELLAANMRSLRRSENDQALIFIKMAKLFSLGNTPKELQGHFYGVALGLRLHPQRFLRSHFDDIIKFLWGSTLEKESPWVGKNFERLDDARLRHLTGQVADPARPAFQGINHFNRLDWNPTNIASYHALTFWLKLHEAQPAERNVYAHDRNGGNYIAMQAPSVSRETPREVFSLNYRWPSMRNRPPLSWLVDELVQIGDGLYLGQLLFASKRLLHGYDPQHPADDYGYNHMGYYTLWDDRWNVEARRLFPFLEIPPSSYPEQSSATMPAPF